MFSSISPDAVIGVVATLLGTILGWALNYLTTNRGKIKVIITSSNDTVSIEEKTDEYTVWNLRTKFKGYAYNQQNHISGINSCRIGYKCNKYYSNYVDVKISHECTKLEDLLNIAPYSCTMINCMSESMVIKLPKNINYIEYTLYFEYKVNGSNTWKRIKIKKQDSLRLWDILGNTIVNLHNLIRRQIKHKNNIVISAIEFMLRKIIYKFFD